MVWGEVFCGERGSLFRKFLQIYLFGVTLHLCDDACVVEFVDGDKVYFVLAFSVPPITHLRILPRFHHLVMEILLKHSSGIVFVVVGDIAAERGEQLALNQRLERVDEAEPESKEIVANFVSAHLAVLLRQQWLFSADKFVFAFKIL